MKKADPKMIDVIEKERAMTNDKTEIRRPMFEYFQGSDHMNVDELTALILELVNDKYSVEELKEDILERWEGEKKMDSIKFYVCSETDVIGEAINKAIEQVAIVVKAAEVAQVSHEKWEQLQEVEDGLYNKGSTWDGTLEGEYKAIDDAYEAELEAIEKKRISSMSNPRLLELAELSQSLLELIDKYQTR